MDDICSPVWWYAHVAGMHFMPGRLCGGLDLMEQPTTTRITSVAGLLRGIVTPESVCRNRSVRVDQLEPYVWQSVCALLQDPSRVMAEWSRRQDARDTSSEHEVQRAHAHERSLRRLPGCRLHHRR